MILRRAFIAAALAVSSLLPAAIAAEPGAERMAAHRAAYRLVLDRVRDGSNVVSARGAMVYEVVDACDGWATRQRFTLTITDRDGQDLETTSDYNTYETKDGRSMRFSLVQTSQGQVSQRVAGEATVTPEGGTITYTEPEAKQVAMPQGTLLPMLHTIRSLAAARAGQRIMVVPLFDGTNAEGAQDTTTVMIGGWTAPAANERFPALAPLGSARMRVAFFDRNQPTNDNGGGARSPDYEVGLRYFENGVADELNMVFGEFSVNGRMEELAVLPGGC